MVKLNFTEAVMSELKKLCREYNVSTFSVFGSFIRKDFNDNSDMDFLVDFDEQDPFKYADSYFGFKNNLEKLFNHKVDLIEKRGLKNTFFKQELENTKVLIYEQGECLSGRLYKMY